MQLRVVVQVVCLLHHGSHVFLPFRRIQVIWFDFLPLNHLFVEFPFHKGAAIFWFIYLSLQYQIKLTVSEISGFLTADSESLQLHLQEM